MLLFIAEEEQAIEAQRQNLARIRQFEPYACFTRLDRRRNGVLQGDDIAAFLRENSSGGVQVSSFECNYVVKFFDSSFFGRLNF